MLVLLLQDIRVHIRGNPEVEEAESVGLRSTQPRIVGSWQCAPKARTISEGGSHPDNCR